MASLAPLIPLPSPDLSLTFREANQRRRAIRHFKAAPVPEAIIRTILSDALLAPSSGNLQPYQLHWIKASALKTRVANACEGQRAATSAPTLVVVVANPSLARETAAQKLEALGQAGLTEQSKIYHRAQLTKFRRFLSIAPLWLLSPLRVVMSLWNPAYSLLPIGPSGIRHWASRSALLAAQTLMLSASAHGVDTCPMEGFDARKVARLLALPRGSVVPLVLALGYRAEDARLEPQSRREYVAAVVEHS